MPSPIFSALKSCTGIPLSRRSMVRSGRPMAEQLRVKFAPSLTVILAGWRVNIGTRPAGREREWEGGGGRESYCLFGHCILGRWQIKYLWMNKRQHKTHALNPRPPLLEQLTHTACIAYNSSESYRYQGLIDSILIHKSKQMNFQLKSWINAHVQTKENSRNWDKSIARL